MPLKTLKLAHYQSLSRQELIKQIKQMGIKIDCRKSSSVLLQALIDYNRQVISKQKAVEEMNRLIDIELDRLSPSRVESCLVSAFNQVKLAGRVAMITRVSNTQGVGFSRIN
jgi:hypothetical protein